MHATLLPDGDPLDGGISAQGRWTSVPAADAERLPGRFVLPGLVDAHCHLSVGSDAEGRPAPLTAEETRANLITARAAGITVVRDLGSPDSITLSLAAGDDGARLLACGRFLAPERRYFSNLHVPVPAEDLVDAALAEVAAGARWVKLIGDFPVLGTTDQRPGDPLPTYSIAEVGALVKAVHDAGARVAAHTTTPFVTDLIGAGIDSVEHGDGLDEADLTALAARGGAWTPTLCAAFASRPNEDPERRGRRARLRERLMYLLPKAAELGVTIMAGTDVVGSIAREVALMTELGLTAETALAAASTSAHRFLGTGLPEIDSLGTDSPGTDSLGTEPVGIESVGTGLPETSFPETGLPETGFQRAGALPDGQPVTLVTYHDDPRADPDVLVRPAAVITGGTRVPDISMPRQAPDLISRPLWSHLVPPPAP